MRRLLIGLILGVLLAVPAILVAAPPKASTVVTPMREDLDANTWNVTNASTVTAFNIVARTAVWLGASTNIAVESNAGPPNTNAGLSRDPGSIYVDSTTGAWWRKTTGFNDPFGWQCVAGCS